jgi:hypothetical protein
VDSKCRHRLVHNSDLITAWTTGEARFDSQQKQKIFFPAQSVQGLRYGPDERGFDSWQGREIFLYSETSKPDPGTTQPPSVGVQVTEDIWA